MVKIVIFSRSSSGPCDPVYGNAGLLYWHYTESSGVDINFQSFGGDLLDRNLENFLAACADADMVIVDPFAYDPPRQTADLIFGDEFVHVSDPEAAMLEIVRRIHKANANTEVYAMLQDRKRAPVHITATSLTGWGDRQIIGSIKLFDEMNDPKFECL